MAFDLPHSEPFAAHPVAGDRAGQSPNVWPIVARRRFYSGGPSAPGTCLGIGRQHRSGGRKKLTDRKETYASWNRHRSRWV